jgi:succinoglycan biosynthesis transport protein ExoP
MKLLAGRPAGQSGAHYRPEGAAVSAEQPVFRIQLVRSLRLHRRLAIGVAAIIFVLMMAAHFAIRPTYTATSVVYVQPSPQTVVGRQTANWSYDSRTYDAFIQQQVQAVTRPDILEAAIRATGPGVFQGSHESVQSAADHLGKMLTVQREGKSYQVSISLTGKDRNKTARMVNAVTAAYLAAARSDEFAGSAERIAMLRDESNRIQQSLNADYAEQAALSKQLGVANATPGNTDPYSAQIDTLHAELLKARADHDQAEAELNALTSGGPRSAALAAATQTILAKDPGLSTMKGAMSQRRSQLIAQMSQLKPANPVYQQDQAELNKLNQSLDEMTAKLQTQAEQQVDAQVRADLDRTGSVDAQLTSQLNATTALATTATPKMQRANELNADIQRLQQRYAAIDTRLHNVELDSSAPAAVHLSSAAQPPVSANGGMRHKLVLLALPFALLFGLFSALAANALDRHVHTPGDVQHILGFAPLGVLPEATLVTPAVEQEYLLRLAAGIDHAAASAHAKTFVVTGVGASETSDLAHALGTTLARIGRRTLTLDSASVLAPAEPHESEASSAPEGSVVEQNLRRLSAANEVVLIDAPPLLLSAGTEYLARFTDATLLVCDSGRTQRADVARAARLLDRIQAPGVGAILTSIPPRTADPEFLADLKATQDRLLATSRSARRGEMESDTWRSLHPHPEETPLQTAANIPLPAGYSHAPERIPARPPEPVATAARDAGDGGTPQAETPTEATSEPEPPAAAVVEPLKASSLLDDLVRMEQVAPTHPPASVQMTVPEAAPVSPPLTPEAQTEEDPFPRHSARNEIIAAWTPRAESTWMGASMPPIVNTPITAPQVPSQTSITAPSIGSEIITQPQTPSATPVDRAAAFDALLHRLMEAAAQEKPEGKTPDRTEPLTVREPDAEKQVISQVQQTIPMPRWDVEPEPSRASAPEIPPTADMPPVAVVPVEIAVPRKQASVLPPEKANSKGKPEPDLEMDLEPDQEPAQRPRRRFEEYAFPWNDPGTGDLAILPPHAPGQYGKGTRRRR